MQLVRPETAHLAGYLAALERGWSPDNLRSVEATREELAHIRDDSAAFLARLEDRDGKGPPITLPDGSLVARLPGFRRWLWDGEFAGSIDLRWQPGTPALPPHCLGHIGYSVVAWKRRRGYATAALRQMLPEARALGLPYVELTTDADNLPSQRVIEAAGGRLHEHFAKPPQFGGKPSLRYRIALSRRRIRSHSVALAEQRQHQRVAGRPGFGPGIVQVGRRLDAPPERAGLWPL